MPTHDNADALYDAALEMARSKNANPILTLDVLSKAVDRGSAKASYALATWYLFGKCVEKDLKKAVQLLRKAASSGVADAMFDLAVCYEKGAGLRKNPKKALEHYLMAALRGDAKAIHEVGRCYWHGIGILRNRTLANIYLDRAKELGVER